MKYCIALPLCLSALAFSACKKVDQAEPLEAFEMTQSYEVVPDQLAYLYSPPQDEDSHKQHQIYAGQRRWHNGRTLRVCFFAANAVTAKLVRSVASEWNQSSGVKLDFGPDDRWTNCLDPRSGFSEIRIGFSDRGYWSYLGSDSERYGGDRSPSMNLDGFNRIYSETRYSESDVVQRSDPYHRAVIRHEFGHALGLLHEHQNPNLKCTDEIRWDGPNNVFEYFSKDPNNWTPDQVIRNLGFVGETDPDYISGDPDPESVMMYSLPSSIFKNGVSSPCYVQTNHEISRKDRIIIGEIYPDSGALVNSQTEDGVASELLVKAAPIFATEDDRSNYLTRVIADLEANDATTRRNARTRLATVFTQASPEEMDVMGPLFLSIPDASYRYKLGIAEALRLSPHTVVIPEASAVILHEQAKLQSDRTLKRSLMLATKNITTAPVDTTQKR